ncbi:unnamed protein product [Cuscuta campestris]|uniref:BRCT domain-containing protein n=1 Tax=Cuscuta campestris TaxID=132261 RepID=A0A484NN31_9ASTE|nr:unnamed protein product [Cuscuta campestris]
MLSAIVESTGGNVVIGRVEKVKDKDKSIFVACEEDTDEAQLAAQKGIRCFSSEWFMNCIMKQQLDIGASQFAGIDVTQLLWYLCVCFQDILDLAKLWPLHLPSSNTLVTWKESRPGGLCWRWKQHCAFLVAVGNYHCYLLEKYHRF